MDFVTLRCCTMKSKIGFGKYPTQTIEQVLVSDARWVRQIYYTVENIDFTDDVKAAADIRIPIPKPGANRDAWIENDNAVFYEKINKMSDLERIKYFANRRKESNRKKYASRFSDYMASQTSKGQLQAINQGKMRWHEKRNK